MRHRGRNVLLGDDVAEGGRCGHSWRGRSGVFLGDVVARGRTDHRVVKDSVCNVKGTKYARPRIRHRLRAANMAA